MANEFVARKGLISSGSINVSGSVTASFFKGDGSQLTNLPTANTALNIDTYTFIGNAVTTNYVLSQSYDVNSLVVSVEGLTLTNVLDYSLSGSTLSFVTTPPTESNILVRALINATQNITGSFTGSFLGLVTSASFAQTASYALNAGAGAGFPFSGSAVITGSLEMVNTANRGGITGSVSGALTGTFPYSGLTGTPTLVSSSSQIDYNSITNKLSGVVSSSIQIQPLLPGGTVSSSAQINSGSFTGSFSGSFNGINLTATSVTASRYTGSFTGSILANNGVVSGAAQISALLPAGTVSSSTQVSALTASLATTGSNTFIGTETISGSLLLNADTLVFTGSMSVSGSVSIIGTITGSIQTASYVLPSGLPAGTVSSSAQYPGWVTASSQIDYNLIQNKLSGVISSSTQIQPLLPGGTVSASGQVDITTTTNYSTFSSSIATKNDLQDISIGALNAATSSYAINSTIQSQLAGVVSSSAQVKPLLPADTVSSSGQVDYNFITNKLSGVVSSSTQVQPLLPANTVSSSAQVTTFLPTNTVSSSTQIDYNNIQNKLSGVVSSSSQVQPLLPIGSVSSSAQYPGWVTASSQIDYNSITNKLSGVYSSSTQAVAAIAGQTIVPSIINATGAISGASIQASGNGTIGGSLTINQNLIVLGSSSVSYISQSTLNIGTNIITMNTNTPGTRLGGIEVIDSGSSPLRSGSLYFDSINDQWIFVHQNTAGGVTSSVVVMGPPTFNSIGNETLLTQNRVLKGGGLEHITDSQITDNGITVSITNGLSAGTTITASSFTATTTSSLAAVYSSSAQTVAAIAGQTISPTTVNATTILSSSVLQTGTNALIGGKLAVTGALEVTGTVTASNLNVNQAVFTNASDGLVSNAITGTGNVVMSASPTLTGTITATNITATGTMLLAGIISSSAQVDYNNIQNKLSGVVSSSTQVATLLPANTVSGSTASSPSQGTVRVTINGVNTDVDTGLQTGDSPTFAGLEIVGGNVVIPNGQFYRGRFNGGTAQNLIGMTTGNVISIGDFTNSWDSQLGGNLSIQFLLQNSERMRLTSTGLGIGTTSPNARLSVNGNANITGSLDVTGAFTAQTKSFKIKHQREEGKSLIYGVLEGPEHAVYARGKLTNSNTIILPKEWEWLVDMDSVTVQLTPIGSHQKLYVKNIDGLTIIVGNENILNSSINCYYIVHATRKDVDPLQTVQ